ncbi:MAG: hypothetical protein L0332_31135, partial [Chloroflexi bacterium]|nr:hypothetical protein [Chloroflexota bacterium]
MAIEGDLRINLGLFKTGQDRLRLRLVPLGAIPGGQEDLALNVGQQIQQASGAGRQARHKLVRLRAARQVLHHQLWFAPSGARIAGGLKELGAGLSWLATLPDEHGAVLCSADANIE